MIPKKQAPTRQELQKQLQDKVAGIVTTWRENPKLISDYLLFAGRFRKYSHVNTRLIYAQRPGASFVASAAAFYAGLPNSTGDKISEDPIFIKKGETALRVWCPTSRTFVMHPDSGEWIPFSHLSKKDQSRASEEGWKTVQRQNFTLVPVFDVSQTTLSAELYPRLFGFGDELPSFETHWTAAVDYAVEELHCTVKDGMNLGSALTRGKFLPKTNEILISEMLKGDGKLSTLLHEIGHAELHADPEAAEFSTARKELEADMYALMLEQRLGIETIDSRKSHLVAHYVKYIKELEENTGVKTLALDAEEDVFDRVIRRYRQQLPVLENRIALAAEEQLQTQELASAKQVQPPLPTPGGGVAI